MERAPGSEAVIGDDVYRAATSGDGSPVRVQSEIGPGSASVTGVALPVDGVA